MTIYVDDQAKALRFYSEVLGFKKKADFSNGGYRWLTVASAEAPDGPELQLEANTNPAARAFQQAKFQQSQPAAMFFVDDVQAEYDRLEGARGEVHHAAHQGDGLDHRHAGRHLRQPRPDRRARSPAGLTGASRRGVWGACPTETRLVAPPPPKGGAIMRSMIDAISHAVH